MKEIYLTEKELARKWSLTAKTLQRWRWSNRGPSYFRIGGRIRYGQKSITDYENKNLHQPRRKMEVSYA